MGVHKRLWRPRKRRKNRSCRCNVSITQSWLFEQLNSVSGKNFFGCAGEIFYQIFPAHPEILVVEAFFDEKNYKKTSSPFDGIGQAR